MKDMGRKTGFLVLYGQVGFHGYSHVAGAVSRFLDIRQHKRHPTRFFMGEKAQPACRWRPRRSCSPFPQVLAQGWTGTRVWHRS